jgi:hypothetical protein
MLLFIIFSLELMQQDPQRHDQWKSRILENALFPDWEPAGFWTR